MYKLYIKRSFDDPYFLIRINDSLKKLINDGVWFNSPVYKYCKIIKRKSIKNNKDILQYFKDNNNQSIFYKVFVDDVNSFEFFFDDEALMSAKKAMKYAFYKTVDKICFKDFIKKLISKANTCAKTINDEIDPIMPNSLIEEEELVFKLANLDPRFRRGRFSKLTNPTTINWLDLIKYKKIATYPFN